MQQKYQKSNKISVNPQIPKERFRNNRNALFLSYFNVEKGLKLWRIQKLKNKKEKEITDKLEEGIKEFFESEMYKSYLFDMSRFHN